MTRLLRRASVLFFALALAGIAILWIADSLHALRFTPFHQRAGALALILIGISYIALQLSLRRGRGETLKGIFLGAAFVLWGGEQFVPSGPLMTAMDSAVITIFVVDLSLIIVGEVRRRN